MTKYHVDIEVSGEVEADSEEEARELFLEDLEYQFFIGNAIVSVMSDEDMKKRMAEIRIT